MILVSHSTVLRSPSGLSAQVTGTEKQLLKKLVGDHHLHTGTKKHGSYSVEFDGDTTSVTSFEQRSSVGSITFLDDGRFIQEAQEGDMVRRASMVRLIHVKGQFIASTMPMTNDLTAEESKVGDVAKQAGFTVENHEVFDLPCYVYRYGALSLASIFGEETDGIFEAAKMLRSYGPAELLLQAIQIDSETRSLLAVSETTGMRTQSAVDEVGVLLDFLELRGVNDLVGLMHASNALQCLRFAKITNPNQDEVGLGLMIYYAMMDSAYIGAFPLDVIQAVAGADSSGKFTIKTFEGVNVPTINGELRQEDLSAIGFLRLVDNHTLETLAKARALYKMLLAARYLEFNGYPANARITLKTADRLGFFNLMV